MDQKSVASELRLLRRSIGGSGLLGLLAPAFAKFVLKDEAAVETAGTLGFIWFVFALIHLSYLQRVEKKLAE